MELLDHEFEVLYPLFVRRMKLLKLTQSGKDERTYIQQIQSVILETMFDTLDRGSFCVLQLAKTFEVNQLREKLFQLKNPEYKEH